MRKIGLLLVLLLLLLPASAQKRWNIIPQAGIQISNIKSNNDLARDPKAGYRVGVLGEYQFSQGILGHVALQSGLFASSKGFRSHTESTQVRSHYLEVPLLLNLGVHVTREVDMHIKAGPYFGYWFAGSSVATPPVGMAPDLREPFYCPYDYGVEIGVGATWKRIQLNIGGNFGLYDFYIDRSIGGDCNMMNRTFHITVGYIL